jgi:hypothetical protein
LLWFVGLLCPGNATAAWHHPLYLDGGGWWRQRIEVQVSNDRDIALVGHPIELPVGEGPGQLALVGQRAESVRVCSAQGTELLFALYGPDGAALPYGPIPAAGRLVIPIDCDPQAKAVCEVYFDNPDAGQVPDFLAARAGLVNGDVEEGQGDAPWGWMHDRADDQHRASWSDEHPQSGRRCLKTVVADGAEPTWIATRQRDIAIVGGAEYRLQAWVRAENVRGLAGWYLHVGNREQPMMTAPTLSAGDGTFAWKQVTADFVAPAEADRVSLGTVLRGTGTAWFDHVTLECLSPGRVRTEVSPVESVGLTMVGADAVWYRRSDPAVPASSHRAAVHAWNFGDQPLGPTLVTVGMGRLEARMRGRLNRESILVTLAGKPVPHKFFGDQLLFEAQLQPRSAYCYYVYFSDDPCDPSTEVSAPSSLADVAANLVRNPSFEQGDGLPDAWTNTGPQRGTTFELDDPRRQAFGRRCVKMRVPADAPAAWRGWHQSVEVRPGRTYLMAAWVKCEGVVQGEVRVHAHRHTADGSLSRHQPYASIGPSISGTADWTLMADQLTMPEDTVALRLHLTMQHVGVLWHDGVAVVEVVPGAIVRLEGEPSRSADGLSVWQVPAVVKVFPDDPAPQGRADAEISAARNEMEPLQLALRSTRGLANVRAVVDAPAGPGDFRLQDTRVEVVGYVPIDHPSSYYRSDAPAWHRKIPTGRGRGDGWSGLWPDPLLPRETFDLRPQTTQPLWITVAVPKQAPPGEYTSRIRFMAQGRTLAEVPFRVQVWDFTLPDENHVAAIYDVRLGRAAELWGKPLDEMYPEIIRLMASRRLCPDTIRPAPRFRCDKGIVTADFAEFDKAARLYFEELKFPYAYTPWDFYLFGWGHPPKTVFGERPYAGDPPYESADRSRLRPQYREVYQQMLRVFWEHLKEKGWEKRVVLYISDEPFDQHEHIRRQMKALCDMIHEVDPAIPIYSSTWKHVPPWDGFLDIWGIGHDGRVSTEKMAQLRAAGDRIWFTTDGQMCTDTPYCAVERLLPHYCFKYGAEAYEFWGVAWLTYDPFRFGWHSYIHQSSEPGESTWVRYPNGDGFLLYPGHLIGQEAPVTSIRCEQAREGVEDYEYLYLLRQLIERAKQAGRDTNGAERALHAALQLVEIPNAGGYYSTKILPRPERLDDVRRRLAAAIESLQAANARQ